MGNEQSTAIERQTSLKKPERHENGSVHGVSANVTSNGLEVDVKGDTLVKQNGGPPSLDHPTETTDGHVAVKTDSGQAPVSAPDLSNILETATKAGEVLETVNSKKDEVLETVNNTKDNVLEIVNQKKDEVVEIVNEKTDEVLEVVTEKKKTSLFGKMFKKKAEPPPEVPAAEDKSAKEEAPEESPPAPAQEPESGSRRQGAATTIIADLRRFLHLKAEISTQTERKTEAHIWTQTGLDDDTILIESAVTEESCLSDSVVVIGEEAIEITTNAEPLVPGLIIEEVVIMDDSVYENIVFEVEQVALTADVELAKERETPFDAASSLPTAVPQCAEAGVAAGSGFTYYAAVNMPKPIVPKDNSKWAGDIAVTYNAGEAICIPSPEVEPMTLEMDPIFGGARKRLHPAPANQLKPDGLPFPKVKVGYSYEEVAADYEIISLGDELGTSEQKKLIPVSDDVAFHSQLITIEELPEDTPDNEAKPEPFPEVEVCQDVAADLEPSPVIVKGDAEVVQLAAIDALALDFAATSITPQETEVEYNILVKEEVIIATTFIPLTGEEEEASVTITDDQCEAVADEINVEATESLLTGIKAMPEEDTTLSAECVGTTKQIPNISMVSAEESPSPYEDDTVIRGLENIPQSVIGTMSERLEVKENTAEEPTAEKTNTPVQELLKDAETAGPSLVTVETKFAVNKLLEQQIKTDELMATFENKLKSVAEAFSEKFQVIKNTFEGALHEQENVQLIPAAEDYEPCISVQRRFGENFIVAEVHRVEDDQESTLPIEVAVEGIEKTDVNPVDFEMHVEDGTSFLAQQPTMKEVGVKFKNTVESVGEALSHKLELDIVEETLVDPPNVPQVDATEECKPCVSVQERLIEVNITPARLLLEDADEETVIPSVEDVEYVRPIEPNPFLSDDLVADSTSLLKQHTEAKKLGNTRETIDQAYVPQMETQGQFKLCASFTGRVGGEYIAPVGVLFKDAVKENASPIAATKHIEVKIPVIPEEPVVDLVRLPKLHPRTEVLVIQSNLQESVAEAYSETVKVTQNIMSEPVDDQVQLDASGESIQASPFQVNVARVVASLQDADEEKVIPPVEEVECIRPAEPNPIFSDDLVADSIRLLKQQAEAEKLWNTLETVDQVNVPQMETTGKFKICASVGGRLGGEYVTPAGHLFEDTVGKHVSLSVAAAKHIGTEIPVIAEEPVVDVANLPEVHPRTEDLVVQSNLPESVAEAYSKIVKVSQNIMSEPVEDQVHLPQLDHNGESIQASRFQVNVVPIGIFLEDADEGTVIPPVDAVEYVRPTQPDPIFSDNLVGDCTSLLKQHTDAEKLDNTLESVDKSFSTKLQVTGNIVLDDKANVPLMEPREESKLWDPVEGGLGEGNINLVGVLLGDGQEKDNPVIAEGPVVDIVCLPEVHQGTEVLVVQSYLDVVKDVKGLVDDQVDAKGEFKPCASFQESLFKENVAPVEALLKEACEETALPSLVSFESNYLTNLNNPIIPDESAEESSSLLKQQPATTVLLVMPENSLESVAEDVLVKPEVVEKISVENVLEQTNVPWVDPIEEHKPCVSVQDKLFEEIVTPAELQLEDACRKTISTSPSVVEVECTELTDAHHVISSESAEDTVTLLEKAPKTEGLLVKLENHQESYVGVISGKFEVTEHIVEKQPDTPLMDATGDSKSWVSVQEDLVEESVVPSVVLNPAISEGNVSHHEEQPKTEGLMVSLETTDEDSELATSGYVDAVLDSIVEEIVTETIVSECNLTLGQAVTQEIDVEEKENSTDFTSDSQSAGMTEDSSATSSVMDDLVVRLQSACTSVVAESEYELGGLEETAKAEQEPEPEPSPPPEPIPVPESVTEEEKAPEPETENSEPEEQEESIPEENPVMNFFKTLVTPTKTTKKDTAAPAAAKDQSPEESQPETTTTVAQVSEPPAPPKGMSIPPPPPPEPPKMEIKAEPATKPAKASPKPEPKAAAKEPEPSKQKSPKNPLSSFFRSKVLLGVKAPKFKRASSGAKASAKPAAGTSKKPPEPAVEVDAEPVVEAEETPVEVPEPAVEAQNETVELLETAVEAAQPVVETVEDAIQPEVEDEKVDPSKVVTLEAAAKPEPPAPAQEEKKPDAKTGFLSFFKPKVLLDNMTTKVQAASTSGVRFLRRTAGVAADSKKATPAPAAAAEAAQTAKAKEEPKAAAKTSEAAPENKPASAAPQAGDDAASVPKKLEKRNSIHTFFKSLGQRRNSTDAGVQTEPAAPAAAEKAK